ncbi:MAG: diguanylate cyclase [Solirubrobacteraceae bacterium]|nr:diguanylate cyclase [Solirubrobacteraceae bacterium]
MNRARLSLLLLPLALLLVAGGMFSSASLQRSAATRADARTQAATRLQTGMLDQETGVRGYLLNGRDEFLVPFREGHEIAVASRKVLDETADGDAETETLVRRHGSLDAQWRAMALVQIAKKRADPTYRGMVSEALERKALMDEMRAGNADLETRLVDRRNHDLDVAGRKSAGEILLLTLLIGLGALALLRRDSLNRGRVADRESRYRSSQQEFIDVIQVVGSEDEGHRLLKRHLELTVHGARATVLDRNEDDNRLDAMTPVDDVSVLSERLGSADAASCLAIKLGRPQRSDGLTERLLTCDLCGQTGARIACEPLLVGGKVSGSVLIETGDALDETAERRVHDSVTQAAPVLANLRNLALAEQRASTDALTGLPNRRAVQDTLARMVSQASRSVQPLAAITIDLDRFKDINDRFGHETGDAVLAHAASLLREGVRSSDFCGRLGGEEFLVLAPDTGVRGAVDLAEKLRAALQREPVAGLDRDVTASFGIAVLPDHAGGGEVLMRLSDRALYTAKSLGRNRVEVVDGVAGAQA